MSLAKFDVLDEKKRVVKAFARERPEVVQKRNPRRNTKAKAKFKINSMVFFPIWYTVAHAHDTLAYCFQAVMDRTQLLHTAGQELCRGKALVYM